MGALLSPILISFGIDVPSKPIVALFNHGTAPVELLSDAHTVHASQELIDLVHTTNPGKRPNDLGAGMIVSLFWQPKSPPRAGETSEALTTHEASRFGMLAIVTSLGSGTIQMRPILRIEAISPFQKHASESGAADLHTVLVSRVKPDPLSFEEQLDLSTLNSLLVNSWHDEIRSTGSSDVTHLIRHMKRDSNLTVRLILRSIAEKKLSLQGKLVVHQDLLDCLKTVMQSRNQLERLRTVHKYYIVFKSTKFAYDDVDKMARHNIQESNTKHLNYERQKVLKSKLGLAKDDRKELRKLIEERFAITNPPEAIRKAATEELNRLDHLEPATSEFAVIRTYLEWIAAMPWTVVSQDNFDLEQAEKVLNEDHYGLEEVKDTILQFMAIAARNPNSLKGKILLLVGPPGTGKSSYFSFLPLLHSLTHGILLASIAESIARALGRKHFRISGAMSDPAELKGHRRTYLGAVPGKVVYGMKKVQVSNPVITIDEIDKVGNYSHRGDPSAVLLELLDPEQNNTFQDHYLDLPLDCSKAIFICTANSTDSISAPLLDRMQVIRLSGYVADEKLAILQQHILPRIRRETGLNDMVKISESSQRTLVEQYSREAGVRNLMKYIERIYRKAALRLLQSHQQQESELNPVSTPPTEEAASSAAPLAATKPHHKPLSITEKNLRDFVGQPPHTDDQPYENGATPVGVVTGLAWTQLGGSTLVVETVVNSFEKNTIPTLTTTGNLEEVMRESSKIAHTFAKRFMATKFPSNGLLDTASLHMHVPSGAIKKDGPSAGVTIVTALLSLALNRPVKPKLAMTGEISLTGRVIRIGGVREKTMAAKQFGCDTIVLPAENKSDFDKLPAYIKGGLSVHFAKQYEDVFSVALGDQAAPAKTASAPIDAPAALSHVQNSTNQPRI